MKKTRFIPYGYTMRNGRTVIEHGEADIIRYIFDEYIKGASLKDLAEELRVVCEAVNTDTQGGAGQAGVSEMELRRGAQS